MAKPQLVHDLAVPRTLDDAARQGFVSALRAFVLHDLADDMRAAWEEDVKPAATRRAGHEPATPSEVHDAMQTADAFRFYSALRVNAQEMVWDSVRDQVHRERDTIQGRVTDAIRSAGRGSLNIPPDFEVPRYVSALDVHRMPGNYHMEFGPDDATQGAFYDNGSSVFFMGLLGKDQGDIGRSIAQYARHRFPDLQPRRILDTGCLVGHNSVPWALEFPEAEVHAIDVAAPGLRYGLARAQALDAAVHFHQMDAAKLDFPDEHFDVVWSSMFYHEVPLKHIVPMLRECHRVLRKGGLMIHMELPPNKALSAYDGFYLDWDSWYNLEPFYKAFRDQDPRELCVRAGFDADSFQEFVVPSFNSHGAEAIERAAREARRPVNEQTGRLVDGLTWYAFGARK
jgi:ubiquinone/menaquinone biosynthesis C-methylase UbiE